jgi:16S rRNA (uracil1498-N3)-methyltransferase
MESGHLFACFTPLIDSILNNAKQTIDHSVQWRIEDSAVVHRLYRVIRLLPQQRVILFGKKYSATIVLQQIHNSYISFCILTYTQIAPPTPIIHLWMPLLEKSSLEEACYTAIVMGVSELYIIPTHKSKRSSLTSLEKERLERIMISAAEQSKQFFLPNVTMISSWEMLPAHSQLIVADLHGLPAMEWTHQLSPHVEYTIMIGPEGDFTESERTTLASLGAIHAKLTPSVLRSEDALMVILGIVRSLLNT